MSKSILYFFLYYFFGLINGLNLSAMDLRGATIRSVFMNDPAFLRLNTKPGYKPNKRNINQIPWEGIIPDIFETLAGILNFTFVLYQPEERKFGNFNESSGEWNGMIREIHEKNADIIAAGLIATLERSQAVDFSLPTYTASHVFLVARGASDYSFVMFFKPFTTHTWFVVYAIIIFASFIMFTTVKISKDTNMSEFSLRKSFTYTFGAFSAFSVRRWSRTPERISGR